MIVILLCRHCATNNNNNNHNIKVKLSFLFGAQTSSHSVHTVATGHIGYSFNCSFTTSTMNGKPNAIMWANNSLLQCVCVATIDWPPPTPIVANVWYGCKLQKLINTIDTLDVWYINDCVGAKQSLSFISFHHKRHYIYTHCIYISLLLCLYLTPATISLHLMIAGVMNMRGESLKQIWIFRPIFHVRRTSSFITKQSGKQIDFCRYSSLQ